MFFSDGTAMYLPTFLSYHLLRLSTHMNTETFRLMKTCLLSLTQKKTLFRVNTKVSLLGVNLVFRSREGNIRQRQLFIGLWRFMSAPDQLMKKLDTIYHYAVSCAPSCTLYAAANCPQLVNFHIELSPLPGSLILCSCLQRILNHYGLCSLDVLHMLVPRLRAEFGQKTQRREQTCNTPDQRA